MRDFQNLDQKWYSLEEILLLISGSLLKKREVSHVCSDSHLGSKTELYYIKKLCCNEQCYKDQLSSLKEFCIIFQNLQNDIHIIAIDLPGHGDSDTPTEDHDISHFNTCRKLHQVEFEYIHDRIEWHFSEFKIHLAKWQSHCSDFCNAFHLLINFTILEEVNFVFILCKL